MKTKTISILNDRYEYLSESNILVNKELRELYPNVCQKRKVKTHNFNLSTETISKAIGDTSQIIFEVTQDCNLRCSYCVFSEHYPFERKLSGKKLEYEIAWQGLKLFYKKIKDRPNKELTICFYGGEPLLAFGLIRKIVNSAKSLFLEWKLKFTVTTNGTILSDEIMDFFISNKFSLCISLDGPAPIHDAKRKFPGGSGSFEKVWENVLKIYQKDRKYFIDNVSFNVVYSKDLPINERLDFFNKTVPLKDGLTTASFVTNRDTNYYKRNKFSAATFEADLETVLDKIKEKLLHDEKLTAPEVFFKHFVQVRALGVKYFPELAGACVVGKPLIDVFGNFHFCEQINNKFSFGDVWNGVDYEKLEKIITGYREINKNHCSECEIKYLCSRCYLTFAKDGVLQFDEEVCKRKRKNIQVRLEEHVQLKEKAALINNDKKRGGTGKIYKFHQFVKVTKGPSNSAIIDLLAGNVFQVDNKQLDTFLAGECSETHDFLKALKSERLVIAVEPGTWIPETFEKSFSSELERLNAFESYELEIEMGADIQLIRKVFDPKMISRVIYYGAGLKNIHDDSDNIFPFVPTVFKEKDFEACKGLCRVNGDFPEVSEDKYFFNVRKNSCWGNKVTISKDNKVRPCIHSDIVIGDLEQGGTLPEIIEKAKDYWSITKDQVEICCDCELRYVCFDCREIAQRSSEGNLLAPNPFCGYNPSEGKWDNE